MSDANLSEMYDAATRQKDEGDLEGAVASLQKILEIDESHVNSHMALGVYLQRLGRLEEAIKHATRVTELEPNDAFSFTQLSVILQRCNRIQEAEDAMAQAHVIQGRPASTGQPPESKHAN